MPKFEDNIRDQWTDEASTHNNKNRKIAEKVFGLTVNDKFEFLYDEASYNTGHHWLRITKDGTKDAKGNWYPIPDYYSDIQLALLITSRLRYGHEICIRTVDGGCKYECSIGKAKAVSSNLSRAICDAALAFVGEDYSGVCCECYARADWVRHTQFSGDHPYCDNHANMQQDFGKDTDNVWEKFQRS